MKQLQIAMTFILIMVLVSGVAQSQDTPQAPESCPVIGDAWINWWSNTMLQVWWNCSKTARTERWSCHVQVESPSRQTYDLLWRDTTPGPFDYTVLEKSFPFFLEMGIWKAVDGTCWADGQIGGQWVKMYEREITHNGYPLSRWPFEQLIGGLDVVPESITYIPLVVR